MKWILSIFCIIFVILLLIFPADAMTAAKQGFILWFNKVMPAILPFMIFSTLLVRSGFLNKPAPFLIPFMRPFGLPGSTAPVFIIGAVSGYPVGAKIAGELEREGLPQEHAGRLAALSNLCSPMFLIGTIAISFLGAPQLGWVLLFGQLISTMLTGIVMQLIKPLPKLKDTTFSLKPQDLPPIGALFADVINDSILSVIRVGGILAFFCVLITLLDKAGILLALGNAMLPLFKTLGLSEDLVQPFLKGLLEPTEGCVGVVNSSAPLFEKLLFCSGLITLGGFSVSMQALSFCKMKPTTYMVAKIFHALLACGTVVLILQIFPDVLPVFAQEGEIFTSLQNNLLVNFSIVTGGLLSLGTAYLLAVISKKRVH